MTIHKLTVPNKEGVSFIGSESDPTRRCWLIFGIGYTESPAVAVYAARRDGYTVAEAQAIPDEYKTAVSCLESAGVTSGGIIDGADPNSVYQVIIRDGRTVDVRDVLAGTITA